jgi:hypothetical protein
MLQKGTVVTTTPTQAPLELAPVVGGSTRRTGDTYAIEEMSEMRLMPFNPRPL